MALADVVHEAQTSCALEYTQDNFEQLDTRLYELENKCSSKLLSQGFVEFQIFLEPYLHMRYDGTDCALMCSPLINNNGTSPKHGDFVANFLERYTCLFQIAVYEYYFIIFLRYQNEFGFTIPDRRILVDDVRVRGVARTHLKDEKEIPITENEAPLHEKV